MKIADDLTMMQSSPATTALKRSPPEQPAFARRTASIKETGEELPLEYWERFEAAVGIKRSRSRLAPNEPGDDIKPR